MKKILTILIAALVFVMAGIGTASALQVEEDYRGNISTIILNEFRDGTLCNIQYPVTSTGATSGIRYRTSEITFAIDTGDTKYQGSINALSLVNVKPGPGQSITSLITIDTKDILQAMGVPADKVDQVQGFFVNDPSALRIGAVIEIYNAGTGNVLDTISSEDQIDEIAGRHGFGDQDKADMHTRFLGGGNPKQPEPPEPPEPPKSPEPQISTGPGLHFQAISQRNAVTGQNIDPPREPDTAKWTDVVTAKLTPLKVQDVVTEGGSPDYSITVAPPPPPSGGCEPNYTAIENWRLVSAKLTYPKQNPHYTFGHPLPPEGTETVDMVPTENGHALTCQFKEMWAENGTNLHDILDPSMDEWIQTPQTYKLTASDIVVEVRYTLVTHHLRCTKDGCDCVANVTRGLVYTYTLSPINGDLLVNGTGVASIGM